MKLRPHHLLCTQGYSGKGYNNAFIDNMNSITKQLHCNLKTSITLTFGLDDVCSKCPNAHSSGICKDNQKVNSIDKKVIDYFNLKEEDYIYQDIIFQINTQMTTSMMDDICSDCEWYLISACKKRVLGYK